MEFLFKTAVQFYIFSLLDCYFLNLYWQI